MIVSDKKTRILFIEYTDYKDFPVGGQTTFASNFAKESTSDLFLAGLSRNKGDEGQWTSVRINEREIPFFSIFCAESTPPPIPRRLWFLFLLLRYRVRIFSKRFDSVIIQSPEISFALLKMGLPLIFNMPGGNNPMLASRFPWARNKVFAMSYHHTFIVPLIKKAVGIVTIDTAGEQLVKSVNAAGKVIRSSVAVNTSLFRRLDENEKLNLRQAMAIPPDSAVVLFAGRLEAVKGLELLIESFATFDKRLNGKCMLYICGDGTQRRNLEKLAVDSGKAGKITFTGALAHDQLTRYFQTADIFAMASHHEGLPNVILEAMSCGLPVVSTDVGGISGVVKDGETGYLTSKRDAETHAGLLLQAYKNREALGESACNLVNLQYSAKTVVGQIEREIQALFQGKEKRKRLSEDKSRGKGQCESG